MLLIVGVGLAKRFTVAIITFSSLDDVDPVLKIIFSLYFGVQAKTIEQLRAKFTLFRISRTDQNKTRRMFDRDALAFDSVSARCRNVEQQIYKVILKQVDFIDIKKAAIGAREQSGIENLST